MENYPGSIIEDKGSALSLKIRIHGETNLIMKTTASYHSVNPAWKNTIIAQLLEQDPESAKLIRETLDKVFKNLTKTGHDSEHDHSYCKTEQNGQVEEIRLNEPAHQHKFEVEVLPNYIFKTVSLNTSVTVVKELQIMNRKLLIQLNAAREMTQDRLIFNDEPEKLEEVLKANSFFINQGGDKDIYKVKIIVKRMSNSTTYYFHWIVFEVEELLKTIDKEDYNRTKGKSSLKVQTEETRIVQDEEELGK